MQLTKSTITLNCSLFPEASLKTYTKNYNNSICRFHLNTWISERSKLNYHLITLYVKSRIFNSWRFHGATSIPFVTPQTRVWRNAFVSAPEKHRFSVIIWILADDVSLREALRKYSSEVRLYGFYMRDPPHAPATAWAEREISALNNWSAARNNRNTPAQMQLCGEKNNCR